MGQYLTAYIYQFWQNQVNFCDHKFIEISQAEQDWLFL